MHTERTKVRPQNVGTLARFMLSGKSPSPPPRQCNVCGYNPTTIEDFRQHVVSKHGMIRVGAQVFTRRFCHCGKPGLYYVGQLSFCKVHREEAVKGLQRFNVKKKYEQKDEDIEKDKKHRDKQLRQADALRSAGRGKNHGRTTTSL